jgi:hypothetical protein
MRVNGRAELLKRIGYLTTSVALPPLLLRTVMFCGFTGHVNSARNLPPPLLESVPINWLLRSDKHLQGRVRVGARRFNSKSTAAYVVFGSRDRDRIRRWCRFRRNRQTHAAGHTTGTST